MFLLSYLGHAYVWGGSQPAQVLPSRVAIPRYRVSQMLGRPPVLSYSSYALHNFYRFNPDREIESGNIGLIHNFLAGIDEEWCILIHVDIEHHAAPGLAALHPCLDAAESRDAEQLETHLATVEHSIKKMPATLKRAPEWCDPYVYCHRVRPDGLIYEGVAEYKGRPQQFRGETGAQSAIVPSLDAMLGIGQAQDMLRTYLMEMRTYMPPGHRAFIESLEARGSIRGFVERAGRPMLTSLYNAAFRVLKRSALCTWSMQPLTSSARHKPTARIRMLSAPAERPL